jgi:hypothetical protein
VGIEVDDLRSILHALRESDQRERLLVLGDALLLFNPPTFELIAREAGYPLKSVPPSLDPFSFGDAIGFERTDTLDVNGNASLTVDLHEDVPEELVGAFDCIIDAGVLFWCFDPAMALRNTLRMARVGATIVHISAVTGHYGRGYYNIHPLLLEDFYLSNGCEFVESSFRTKFRADGLLARATSLLRLTNTVTRYREPGHVYLAQSRLNRLGFAPRYRAPFEHNMVPNNVLGVFIFRKREEREIVTPVRTDVYDASNPRGLTPEAAR